MKTFTLILSTISIIIFAISCAGNGEKKPSTEIASIKPTIETSTTITQKAPIINMADTIQLKRIVLCYKDSSMSREGMFIKLSNIYNNKLPESIKINKIKAVGAPMAWHTKIKKAYFFEAGIPIDKVPTKLGKGIYVKSTNTDSVFIARFFGPNELAAGAYDALNEKLKDAHKTKSGNIYEVYVDNIFATTIDKKDAYKMQTDIVLPYK
jgi:effector-binding domain-containing protein